MFGGRMVAVPRKPGLPMSSTNSRGVLCCNRSSRVVQRRLRARLAPHFHLAALDTQCGGVARRGTALVSHLGRAWMRAARKVRASAALIFLDTKAAFYSFLMEEVTGPSLPGALRERLLQKLELSNDAQAQYSERSLD